MTGNIRQPVKPSPPKHLVSVFITIVSPKMGNDPTTYQLITPRQLAIKD
jgi:hypothetical protein